MTVPKRLLYPALFLLAVVLILRIPNRIPEEKEGLDNKQHAIRSSRSSTSSSTSAPPTTSAPTTSAPTTSAPTTSVPTISIPKPPQRIFISAKFGRDRMFEDDLARYRGQVNATGLFDSNKIYTYVEFPDWILKDPKWSKHLLFLGDKNDPSSRGGGYWFWKSQLIGHHLKELNDGDFLVYSDSDLLNHLKFIDRLMDTMVDRKANLALYEMQYLEKEYSKRDIYEELCDGMDPATDKSLSNAGGFVIIRKTTGAVKLVNEWMETVRNIQLISDAKSKLPNIPQFKGHRHDQSILNALLKCRYHAAGKQEFPGTKVNVADGLDKGNKYSATWTVNTYQV